VRELRNLGLGLTDAATPLKNRIIRRAAGLEGDLPRLARRTP
jgi:2-octaprenylphenol hydroxylase